MAQSEKLNDAEELEASSNRPTVIFAGRKPSVDNAPFGERNELPVGAAKIRVASRGEGFAVPTRIGKAIGRNVELEVYKLREA